MLDTNKLEEKLLNIVRLCDKHLLNGIDTNLDKIVLENGIYYGCKNHVGILGMFQYLDSKMKTQKSEVIQNQIKEVIKDLKEYTLLKVYNRYLFDEFHDDPIDELPDILPVAHTDYEDNELIELQYDYCLEKEERIITINDKVFVDKLSFFDLVDNMIVGGFDAFVSEMNELIPEELLKD